MAMKAKAQAVNAVNAAGSALAIDATGLMGGDLAGAVAVGEAPGSREVSGGTKPRRRHLFNQWVDFLALGGGSVLVLGALAAFYPAGDEARAGLAFTMLVLAHFVNHPHFAHSYQLFYKGFVRKAFSPESTLRHRYMFAGIMVPAILVTFFVSGVALGNPPMLGLTVNLMFFLVGWHYAKQGYGILMLDAGYKGTGFSAKERRHLLWNTHIAWPTYWLIANNALAAKSYWGLPYVVFDVPDPLLITVSAAAAVSAVIVMRDLFLIWRSGRTLPVNGLVAYVASVYLWLMIAREDPLLILVVPVFHSVQYMCVVWRYQLNVETERLRERAGAAEPAWYRTAAAGLARYVLIAGLLGLVGFWGAPLVMDTVGGYDSAVFGGTLFLFMGWTGINIHHYFIDAVIWRRENTDMRRYLFAA